MEKNIIIIVSNIGLVHMKLWRDGSH
jgi:hypothetical protein